MKKSKINKEYIAPATQLFTPDWIVKYMVENSLGKLALESTGINENLKNNWKYYIDSEKEENLEKIKIEDIKILDPAMGSGHILVYTFDLLFEMYENLGWSTKESVLSILKNNLYGLEIDERAGQLASFALMMKAREKFSRLFSVLKREENFKLNTLIIEESNSLSERIRNKIKNNNLNNLNKIIQEFEDAKEYGSILKLESIDKEILKREFNILKESFNNNEQETLIFNEDEMIININEELELIENLIKQHTIMTDKFDITVTNPPYMGNSRMNGILKEYIDKNYPDVKSDLFAVFIKKVISFNKENGFISLVSPYVWWFIKSYEELRNYILNHLTFYNLIQLEYNAFEGATIPVGTFVLKNKIIPNYKMIGIKLSDFKGIENQPIKTLEAIKNPNCNWRFQAKQKDFEKIPGSPIAYWVSDKVREIFKKNQKLGDIGEAKVGLQTGDNNKFLRLWNEVNYNKIGYNMSNSQEALKSKKKWFPYNKGGEFRKWYGNQEYLVNWENDGYEIKNFYDEKGKLRSRPQNTEYYFKESISWGLITSAGSSFRYFPKGFIFDISAVSYFIEKKEREILGILNSKYFLELSQIINPTINFSNGVFALLPALFVENEKFNNLVQQNINISKKEWDSRETSWDFEKLSLIDGKDLKNAYENYCNHWRDNFVQLHKNEEELNRLFIEIYDLQDEMDEKVAFEDITILKKEANIIQIDNSIPKKFSTESEKYLYDRGVSLEFNKDELVKQFLSYAVGCIMGRYSINKSRLIIANSDDILELSENKFIVKGSDGEIRQEIESKFLPDEFGIIPITDEKDFSNDIVEKVKEFIKVVYGEGNLKDNLNFIAEALGNKDNKPAEEIIRTYFIKDFYSDHLQRYQKRPIYWLMNSGKKNAFSCLFYMHRYKPLTVARVRADYLIPYQEMLENKRKFIERQLSDDNISAKEKKNIEKQLKELDTLLKELREYANEVKHIAEQKILLDLDDGVNANYEKLGAILKKR